MLLTVPALVMAGVLFTRLHAVLNGRAGSPHPARLPTGVDDWPGFARLTAVVVVRSVLFFGLTSFLVLYFINELGTSRGHLGSGVVGANGNVNRAASKDSERGDSFAWQYSISQENHRNYDLDEILPSAANHFWRP